MAEYKDIDEILKTLPDDLPYKASVKRVLIQAPTADVVPRSEVDQWYHEYHVIKDELKQEKMYHKETEKLADKYCAELQTAKTEVVREIFDEIEKLFFANGVFIHIQSYNELKKKYTPTETQKSKAEDHEFFTPEEVRAMSMDEVRANYSKILNSMSKWH